MLNYLMYEIQCLLSFAGGVYYMFGDRRWHKNVITSEQNGPQISESRNYDLLSSVVSRKDAGEGPDRKKYHFMHRGCRNCSEANAACPNVQTTDKKGMDPDVLVLTLIS